MIHVVSLGNPLHSDDGFGPDVLRRLSAWRKPDHVRLHDGAEGGIVDMLRHCARALLITGLDPRLGRPGQILRIRPDDYPADPMGASGGGVAAILATIRRLLDHPPEIEIWGVVPVLRIPFSPGLSPPAAAAAATVAAMVQRELRQRSAKKSSAPCNM